MLTVVVVSHLPKDAAIEWHVIAVADDPLQRIHFAMKMLSEGFQIDCEFVESSSASCASISVRLSLISPSASQLDLDGPLSDLVSVFRQAVEKLSEDCNASPLSFRAFFKKDVFDAGVLQTGKTSDRKRHNTKIKVIWFSSAEGFMAADPDVEQEVGLDDLLPI